MRDKAYVSLAILVSLLIWAGSAGAQGEQWLQYRSAREAATIVGSLSTVALSVSETAPEGVELPEFAGDGPLFARWTTPMVPGGGLWLALDRTNASGLPNSLYVDSNGDGRLSDETATTAYRMDQYYTYFGPVKVVFQVADGPVTYHLNLRFYSSGQTKRLYASAGGWYEGDLTIDGTTHHCVLLDYNANGTFNDRSADPSRSDRIAVGPGATSEPVFVGKYLDVAGALYEPQIARDGAFVKLAKAQNVAYGTVQVPECISGLSVGGENGQFIRSPENGTIELPTGAYRITAWTIDRQDDNGAKWSLRGYGASGASPFDVAQGAETAVEIGEPVTALLAATGKDGTYSFSQSLRGRQGESISLMRNGAQPQAPRLNIRSKDGTYDRTFSFSYG